MMEPSEGPSPSLVEDALRDLRNRTLAKLDGDLARLVYLASTRDYNTGRYAHDGLSFRFSESVAETAGASGSTIRIATAVTWPMISASCCGKWRCARDERG